METAMKLRRQLPTTATRLASRVPPARDQTLVCADDVSVCPLGDVRPDDMLFIREGDMVPVDCVVQSAG